MNNYKTRKTSTYTVIMNVYNHNNSIEFHFKTLAQCKKFVNLALVNQDCNVTIEVVTTIETRLIRSY